MNRGRNASRTQKLTFFGRPCRRDLFSFSWMQHKTLATRVGTHPAGGRGGHLGPESFYPIHNVVPNNEHRELLLLSSFSPALHPRWGGMNRGRNTSRTQKVPILREPCRRDLCRFSWIQHKILATRVGTHTAPGRGGHLGPKSFYPIYNVVPNNEHRDLLLLSSFPLALLPRWGGMNRGRNTSRTQKVRIMLCGHAEETCLILIGYNIRFWPLAMEFTWRRAEADT